MDLVATCISRHLRFHFTHLCNKLIFESHLESVSGARIPGHQGDQRADRVRGLPKVRTTAALLLAGMTAPMHKQCQHWSLVAVGMEFDLTRILRVMRPYKGGIAFDNDGMHAVEDYIVSRFQMYQQVYFHPVSRGMEVVLTKLLQRAKDLYEHNHMNGFEMPSLLIPFFENKVTINDYLLLDDGILNTYFTLWQSYPDEILKDLSYRFLSRKPFKSAEYDNKTEHMLPQLAQVVENVGFDKDYYTATNTSYDLPYDVYNPNSNKSRTQIEIMQDDGSLIELSTVSRLVNALTGKILGDERFYFPKSMLIQHSDDIFSDDYEKFQKHIHNDKIVH